MSPILKVKDVLVQRDRKLVLSVPYFDSLLLLARAAIRRAGIEPIALT